MRYKVRGDTSDGSTFYADGSTFGRTFYAVADAWDYARGYAHTVAGRGGSVDEHLGGLDVAYIAARAVGGYVEELRLEVLR